MDLQRWIFPLYSQYFSWGRGWLLGKAFVLPDTLTPGILQFTIKTCQKWGCVLQVCVNSGFFCWSRVKYLAKSYGFRVQSHFLYWGIRLFSLNCFCNILEAVIEREDWIVLDSLNNSLLHDLLVKRPHCIHLWTSRDAAHLFVFCLASVRMILTASIANHYKIW